MKSMTLLYETFLPVILLIIVAFIGMGLVMLLMSLGLPDKKEQEYNFLHDERKKQRLLKRLIDEK